MESKTVNSSKVEIAQLMMPEHANPAGNVHGGTIMKIIDNAGGISAARHTRTNVVTASVDRIDFFSPVFIGNVLYAKASINRAWKSSMEVGVRIEAECLKTGTRAHVGSAYLTFVGMDENDKPFPVHQIIPETEDEKRRYEKAEIRKEQRVKAFSKHKHASKLCIPRVR